MLNQHSVGVDLAALIPMMHCVALHFFPLFGPVRDLLSEVIEVAFHRCDPISIVKNC